MEFVITIFKIICYKTCYFFDNCYIVSKFKYVTTEILNNNKYFIIFEFVKYFVFYLIKLADFLSC